MYYKSVALSSYDSVDAYPQNSPTVFTNILNEPLTGSDKTKPLYVKLRSIALSTKVYTKHEPIEFDGAPWTFMNPAWQYPGYIEVSLKEASAQIVSTGYNVSLGGFPFPPVDLTPPKHPQKYQGEYARHVFKDASWIKLKQNNVTQFSVELTSVTGDPFLLLSPLDQADIVYLRHETPPRTWQPRAAP